MRLFAVAVDILDVVVAAAAHDDDDVTTRSALQQSARSISSPSTAIIRLTFA